MKTSNHVAMLLLASLGFYSCEKVIDVELSETPSQLVIESHLRLEDDAIEVRISRSGSYFEDQELETIESATIRLMENNGPAVEVPHDANGYYRIPFQAETGRTYTLTVEVEGGTYTASTRMLEPVDLMDLETEFTASNAIVDEGYFVFSRFLDSQETANYYRFIHSINGEEQRKGENLQVINDRFIEGGLARIPIFGTSFASDDTITIELLHIDEAAFDYYDSLADIIGDGGGPAGGSAAPGNPNTNWVGGDVLGYFIASSSDQRSVVIPQ